MTNKQVAIVEALLVTGMLYNTVQSNEKSERLLSALTAVYLGYGCFLNLQGRVKMLDKNDPRTKSENIRLNKLVVKR
jgi:hypothetical protein